MIRNCRACSTYLGDAEPGGFYFCSACGSANYVSETCAEEDNKNYFNSIFRNGEPCLIQQRVGYFERFRHQHFKLFSHQEKSYQAFLAKISATVISARRAVEVGFGRGDELLRFLNAGADVYGLDLSQEAVNTFKAKHSEHAYRVACGTRPHFPVEVIYTNALLEHLDAPEEFLGMASASLPSGGYLAMRLPVLVSSPKLLKKDINFWKPCHRVLYTVRGLEILLKRFGFTIIDSASLACYSYKVMNQMLDFGFDKIKHYRNPCGRFIGIDSDFTFILILLLAFARKTTCSDFAFIARLTNK